MWGVHFPQPISVTASEFLSEDFSLGYTYIRIAVLHFAILEKFNPCLDP
jgi:hypothetical protein